MDSAILARVNLKAVGSFLAALFFAIACASADSTNTIPAASSGKVISKEIQPPEQANSVRRVATNNAALQLQATSIGDTNAGPFAVYDKALIAAVRQRWYDLLDDQGYEGYKPGTVRLEFKLHSDGRITDLCATENTVSKALRAICEKAVLGASPFDKWPKDMQVKLGKDVREIAFTFYYN